MKWIVMLFLAGGVSADQLDQLQARQATERAALQKAHELQALQLVEKQVTELQRLAKFAKGKEQKRLRAAIEELLQGTDAGRRMEAELYVEKIDHKKAGAIKGMTTVAEELAITTKDEEGKWARVPEILVGASIYTREVRPSNGVADFTVTKSGRIFLALNYDYQGNSSGGWTNERLSAGQFMARGWAQVRGAKLISWNNRTYPLFTRVCKEGEHFRLRCNKYEPPYAIVLDKGRAAADAKETN